MTSKTPENDDSKVMHLSSDYGLWLGASTSDMLGRSLCNIALPYVIVSLTGSTSRAGLVETVGMVAYLAVTLFGGVVVDRIDRRRGMYARGLSGGILWLVLALLLVSGMLRLWHIFVIVVAIRVLDGLFGMADNAALRSIVTDDVAFTRAVSINQARNAVVRIGGGPLGGFLYGIVHALPFFVASVLLALLALLARLIRVNLRPPQPSEHDESQDPGQPSEQSSQGDDRTARATRAESSGQVRRVFTDIADGCRFIWNEPAMRASVLILMLVNTGFAFTLNSASYHLIRSGYSAFQLSLMEAAYAVLLIIGSALASRFLQRLRAGRVLLVAFVAMFGVSAASAVNHAYVALLVWLALYGLVFPFVASVIQGYTFSTTPGALQGRVNSVLAISELLLTAFVPAVTGALVQQGYATPSFGLGALIAGLAVLALVASRSLRTLGKPSQWHADPPSNDGDDA